MPQGQFTSTDVAQPSATAGRFTSADIDAAPAQEKSDGFWLDLAHRLILNNPVTAGKGVIGSGGVVEGDQPKGEFKWSDAHPSLHNLIQNTADELKRTFAPNAGTAVGNLITLGQAARPLSPATIGSAATAARTPLANAADFASGALDNDFAGAVNPRLPHTGKLLGKAADALRPKPIATTPATAEPAESVFPETGQLEPENAEPSLLEQSKAKFAEQQPTKSETPGYPEGLQKRPTDRADILDDKVVQDRIREDVAMHARRVYGPINRENAPTPKWQQVAEAQAQLVMEKAHQDAAQLLADAEKAATTPKALTKTVTPKAPAAAQPVSEDLNSPNRLIDLMQQSIDAVNARKGK